MDSRELQPYVDYLDKEQIVQGILSTFCVLAAATIIAKVVLVPNAASNLLNRLQGDAFAYVIGTIISFVAAAFFFYQQRSELLGLHGYIVLAITIEVSAAAKRSDSWTLDEALAYADSYSLWNAYQSGLAALYTAGAQAFLALISAKIPCTQKVWLPWSICALLLLVSGIVMMMIWRKRVSLDQHVKRKPSRRKHRL